MKNTTLTKSESELCLKCDAKVCLSEQCKQPQKIVASDFILNIFSLVGFIIFALIAFFTSFFIDIPLIGESVFLGCLVAGILGLVVGHLMSKYAFPLFMKQWRKNKPCKVEELRQREKERHEKANDPEIRKKEIDKQIKEVEQFKKSIEQYKDAKKYQYELGIAEQVIALHKAERAMQDIRIITRKLGFLNTEQKDINLNEITKSINDVSSKIEECEQLLQKLRDNTAVSMTDKGKIYIKKLENILTNCKQFHQTLVRKGLNKALVGIAGDQGVKTMIQNFEQNLENFTQQTKDRVMEEFFNESAEMEINIANTFNENTQAIPEHPDGKNFMFTPSRPKEPIRRK